MNGDSRTEESYFSGSRAKDIRITVNGEYFKEVTLADSPAPQLISLDYTQHTIAKPLDISIEVLSAYPGERPDVYISEIGVGIDSNLPQGALTAPKPASALFSRGGPFNRRSE